MQQTWHGLHLVLAFASGRRQDRHGLIADVLTRATSADFSCSFASRASTQSLHAMCQWQSSPATCMFGRQGLPAAACSCLEYTHPRPMTPPVPRLEQTARHPHLHELNAPADRQPSPLVRLEVAKGSSGCIFDCCKPVNLHPDLAR